MNIVLITSSPHLSFRVPSRTCEGESIPITGSVLWGHQLYTLMTTRHLAVHTLRKGNMFMFMIITYVQSCTYINNYTCDNQEYNNALHFALKNVYICM